MSRFWVFLLVFAAAPALAHQGDHTHLDLAALAGHVFEADHIVFAAIAVLTGILAFRAGRRAEAKAQARKGISHDSR